MKQRLKHALNGILNVVGVHMASASRIGLEVEFDVARLAGGKGVGCVLDVGANLGQTTLRFKRAFPRCRVYSFEPVPQTFEVLKKAVGTTPGVEIFSRAMGAERGKARIHLTGMSATHTMVEGAGGWTGDVVDVDVDTVDGFCADHAIEVVDVLKIDVEGFELQVLNGAAEMLRKNAIRFVYPECAFAPNADAPHGNFFEIHDRLTSLDYCAVAFYSEAFSLKYGSGLGNTLFVSRAHLPASVGGVQNITDY